MKTKTFIMKIFIFLVLLGVSINSLSFACGGGMKAPSDGSSPAPVEEGSEK